MESSEKKQMLIKNVPILKPKIKCIGIRNFQE